MTASAEEQVLFHLKKQIGRSEAEKLVASLKQESRDMKGLSLRERLAVCLEPELDESVPALVDRLADLVTETRIRIRRHKL